MKHRRAALVLVILLVAAGCSTSTEVSATAASDADDPTPVATATVDTQEADTSVETETDAEPEQTEDPVPEPTATATAEPDPPALDESAMAALVGSDQLAGNLTPEELRCVAREMLADDALAARVGESDGFETLSEDDQTTIAILTFDCAPDSIAEAFSTAIGENADFGPEVGTCLVEAMGPDAEDRASVIRGFAALGADEAVPAGSESPIVDTMVDCFPSDLFSDAIEAEVLSNPALASAVDFTCIDQQFTGDSVRPLWETLVRNPGVDFDQLDASATEPMFAAIFNCLSFGKVVAAQAADSGVTLSEASIECIDTAMADVDAAALAAADEGADEVGNAMAGCLTPEELSGLGG